MHCVYWSLLAASRAVSPAEFTVGRAREDVVIACVNSDVEEKKKRESERVPVCSTAFALSSNLRDSGLWCRTL